MAKRHYEKAAAGAEVHATNDPQVLIFADLAAQLPALEEIQGLSESLRTAIATSGGLPSLGVSGAGDLASFDDSLDDRIDVLKDVTDYATYATEQKSLTVFSGEWYQLEAVEAFSAEEVGGEAVNAIDGDHGSWWQSETGPHEITFRLRDYPKQIAKIRLRCPNANDGRSQLQGLTLHASQSLARLDNPGNEVATGLNFTYVSGAWVEFEIPAMDRKRARYIKLSAMESLHSTPEHVRIREIEVFVTTINHEQI